MENNCHISDLESSFPYVDNGLFQEYFFFAKLQKKVDLILYSFVEQKCFLYLSHKKENIFLSILAHLLVAIKLVFLVRAHKRRFS